MNITKEKLDALEKLADAATPGPWEWEYPDERELANVVYYEPYTDGSSGKGSRYNLISRDSGVYGPDVNTCEYIMSVNPDTIKALIRYIRKLENRRMGKSTHIPT